VEDEEQEEEEEPVRREEAEETHSDDDDDDDDDDEEEEEEEAHSEDEGLGSLPFDLDLTLRWEPPEDETPYLEAYAALDPRLTPQSKAPYRRGVSRLPELPYAYADRVLVPAGKRYMI
jgi:ABC-type Zn2+ transport system substrate-binding protein/surface adhesin